MPDDGAGVSDLKVRQVLAAIMPRRREKVLSWIVSSCYAHPESRVLDWVGDRADDLRVASQRWRAKHGRT